MFSQNKQIYIVGSLTQIPKIRVFAELLRANLDELGYRHYEVNDWWTAHGSEVDKNYWQYCKARNLTYNQAIRSDVARSVFDLDRRFIDRAHLVIMIQPCGKSAALELGYAAGSNKSTVIIKGPEIQGIEVMENFADHIFENEQDFFNSLDAVLKGMLELSVWKTTSQIW